MDTSLNVKEKPYVILLFATIALLIVLSFRPIANMDFKEITMFAVPLNNLIWMIPLFLTSLWLFYSMMRKLFYSKTIIWIHVLVTTITTLLIVAAAYIFVNPSPFVKERHELIGLAIQILSILFLLAQFSFIANILLGIFSNKKLRNSTLS